MRVRFAVSMLGPMYNGKNSKPHPIDEKRVISVALLVE